jgi:multidrug resistance efflux pump
MIFLKKLTNYKWHLVAVMVFASGVYYYTQVYQADNTEDALSFYVVNTVGRGEVTSGIQTTGNIVAAQKLDIDVYKQLSRIDVVNVSNGGHVEAGEVLISFDKNDAYVNTQSAKVAVVEAELSLQKERENVNDPNTQIRTKENQILGFKKVITDAEQSIKDAYRDFLNKNLVVLPHSDRYMALADRTEPVLSGRYVNDEQGEYIIEVYASGANSGFSYRVNGLESMTESVIFGKAVDLGTRGIKITFPNDTKVNDKWIVYVPNTKIAMYSEVKQNYETAVSNFYKTIVDAEVNLVNAEQELNNLKITDSSSYRNLNVEKAETALAEAKQRLSKNYDVVQERNIVAPFSGTVEGMQNVVAGATPTGGSSDTINLGTLISDEFLTTFTLGATDVAKVAVGQKVKVTVTSFVTQPVFEATITQISSLPESSGVAQYKIQALLEYDRTTADLVLREGMLADIEVVERENLDALRVPTSAVTYKQGAPYITVTDKLTEEQKQQAKRIGIVRTQGVTIATYDVAVELGIVGQYYIEIVSGLSEGDIIVSSSLTESTTESVVQQAGFGPGSGQRPEGTQNNSSGATTRN